MAVTRLIAKGILMYLFFYNAVYAGCNIPYHGVTMEEKHQIAIEALDNFKRSGQLDTNIKEAQKQRTINPIMARIWFAKQVQKGGAWDYTKNCHPEMRQVNNFNYGATGRAIGFSKDELLQNHKQLTMGK